MRPLPPLQRERRALEALPVGSCFFSLFFSLQELLERSGSPLTPHRREEASRKAAVPRKRFEKETSGTAEPSGAASNNAAPPPSDADASSAALPVLLAEASRLLEKADIQRRPLLGPRAQATLDAAREVASQLPRPSDVSSL